MLSQRYELKFPIGVEQVAPFLAEAGHGLARDAHGSQAAYRVSSQYFDTSDLAAYWEKLDGEAVRRKLRLRYYSVERTGQGLRARSAFMEIKHRINNTVFKERVRLTDDGAQAILSDARELTRLDRHLDDAARRQRATIDAVVRAAAAPGFRAVHVITYLRDAWEGRDDDRLRVTFDTRCQALPPSAFLDVGSNAGAPILPADRCVMEVKFDLAIPRWIRDVIARRGLALRRFSKYAAGVEALGLCDPERRARRMG